VPTSQGELGSRGRKVEFTGPKVSEGGRQNFAKGGVEHGKNCKEGRPQESSLTAKVGNQGQKSTRGDWQKTLRKV